MWSRGIWDPSWAPPRQLDLMICFHELENARQGPACGARGGISLGACHPAGTVGTPGFMRRSPAGHHIMAFIPILYLSKGRKSEIKVLYVCTLLLLLQKLSIKAGTSWLDCFVKRTSNHQDEVTPSLTAKEESQTERLRKTSGHHFNESYQF